MNPLVLEIDEFQTDTCRVAGELRICSNGCRSIERRSISQYSSVYANRFSSSDRLLSSSFCIFANRSLFGFDPNGYWTEAYAHQSNPKKNKQAEVALGKAEAVLVEGKEERREPSKGQERAGGTERDRTGVWPHRGARRAGGRMMGSLARVLLGFAAWWYWWSIESIASIAAAPSSATVVAVRAPYYICRDDAWAS